MTATADYIIHHWYIDFASGTLLHQGSGEQRRLGEYQLRLLQVLAEHAGEILSREELNTLVWERRVIGNNSLPNAIHALRVALEDDGKQQRIIKTIPKKGYILEAEFCQRISREVEPPDGMDNSEAADDAGYAGSASENRRDVLPSDYSPGGTSVPPPLLTPVIQAETYTPARRRFWLWLIVAQVLLLLLVLVWAGRTLFPLPSSKLIEKNSVPYSHIQLMELRRGWESASASYDLNNLQGP